MKKKVITVELEGEALEVYQQAKGIYKMKALINSLIVQWGRQNGFLEDDNGAGKTGSAAGTIGKEEAKV